MTTRSVPIVSMVKIFIEKWSRIHALCSGIASSAILNELDVHISAADDLKHNFD